MKDKGTARALSALAHGAIAFGLFGVTFPVALVISGVIWLYSRRSPDVRFHAEQAGCYQCSVILINLLFVAYLGATIGFSFVQLWNGQSDLGTSKGFGPGLILFALWFVGSILYGLFAAVLVLLGKPFKYPLIGNRFEKKVR